ncbi:MAG: PilZ domain-containing protein [Thiohalomonadales bacterium]
MKNISPIVDHRKFTRIPFNAKVHLVNAEGDWHCELIDVSLQGLLVSKPELWNAGIDDSYLVELQIEECKFCIHMETVVAHIESDQIGFHCKKIDLDSITHLRRLVELNIGNAKILTRELTALGK